MVFAGTATIAPMLTGSNCQYAHGRSELRCTREVYKTSLCRFWLKGKCGPAVNCRHAHGEDEDKTLESYNDMGTDSDDIDKLTEKLYHLIDELAGCPELKHMSTYLRNTRTM
ncbi:hypothetical protein Pmar_PMAR012234 [Perkinsus marinus ATCC 50983]|uniref:C3H1-type domain-containing protein n=1 Tax=Perkinsus marinus (strain ATCC 50983 / TXsc) TaxID=423536 RepID=C5K6V5_PERM5|nr:hypothetical protein Pmar_PMAR012234 [Perkinsus marinus ATCC 50983]EER19790.1 hypothetical protein Pmar_PMAR012234 [Perkinsus marinus ATCC 50983]|eukprot:XP_002787994.1 hypothetical protein Pmar_PMAR012234 [Perkinsus marinus ATCC 50983]